MSGNVPSGWLVPSFMSTPKVKSLDAAAVESVLYIMSPAGLSQLTIELHRRGYTFTSEQLGTALHEVIKPARGSWKDHNGIALYALNGLGA